MKFDRILQQDIEITNRLRLTNPKSRLKPFAIFLAHSGDSWFILLALFIVWLFSDGAWHRMTALMAAGSVGLALVVLVIKFTIKRRRPEGKWGAIYRNTDPHSFPSGHAARTALLAVIALAIGPLWFGLLLAIWAPLVSLARVWMGVHYLSDVVVGILLGVLAGIVVLQLAPWLTVTFPAIF
jgi:undecaprenyl-diphosphatase